MTHTQPQPDPHPAMDWVTIGAIAALSVSLTIGFHEGMHALTCLGVGGTVQELSALHVLCDGEGVWQGKLVAGSASVANILLGTLCWWLLRRLAKTPTVQFFLWLFMLMNWLNGAGYWMFSGIANVGDWAVVIEGWSPHWLWRVMLSVLGTVTFTLFVWLGLKELGRLIGGEAPEQIRRATRLGLLAYLTALVVVALAGLFNPYGFFSLPVTAGLIAVAGGFSPLLWMMQWFQATYFEKLPQAALTVPRSWEWIGAGLLVTAIYVAVLGPTLVF